MNNLLRWLLVVLLLFVSACSFRDLVTQDDKKEYIQKVETAQSAVMALQEEIATLKSEYGKLQEDYILKAKELAEAVGQEKAAEIIERADVKAQQITELIVEKGKHLDTFQALLSQLKANPPEEGSPWWKEILKIGIPAALAAFAAHKKNEPVRLGFEELVKANQKIRRVVKEEGEQKLATVDAIYSDFQSPATTDLVSKVKQKKAIKSTMS